MLVPGWLRFWTFVLTVPIGAFAAVSTVLLVFVVALSLTGWNPLAFSTSFTVRNHLPVAVRVTPIGTYNNGRKSVLPQLGQSPPVWNIQSVDWPIAAGGAHRIHYDWDDINFTEILVKFDDGTVRTLIVDPSPPRVYYYANKQDEYVIADLASLETPSPEALNAMRHPEGRRWWLLLVFATTATLPLWTYRWWQRARPQRP